MYVVDERLVAEAILTRATARTMLPETPFRNDRGSRVRSFRLEHEVRSFRLSGRPRGHQLPH
jgi:hypothetical protein